MFLAAPDLKWLCIANALPKDVQGQLVHRGPILWCPMNESLEQFRAGDCWLLEAAAWLHC